MYLLHLLALVLVLVALGGCWRSSSQSLTQMRVVGTVAGHDVDVMVEAGTRSEDKSGVDQAAVMALAKAAAAAAVEGVKGSIPGMPAIEAALAKYAPAPDRDSDHTPLIAGLTTTAMAAGLAYVKHREAKEQREEAKAQKADSDDAWERLARANGHPPLPAIPSGGSARG